jgi:hypothetical protein
MSGFFDGVYGAKFPDVVLNSGPLPPTGGLPAPLHDTPDGKINYNSTLLGDLQPYAYGEGAYLSTQHSYLNIPHRIQKFVPVIYLPEPNGENTFRLSHGIDDGDVAFSLRLNKNSLFCTGTSNSSSRRNGLGTMIDPFINLPTLNYILAGIQRLNPDDPNNRLWLDFLHALDQDRFPDHNEQNKRNYKVDRLDINDILHIIQNCIRPFGIMRGSEKQGGQNEMSQSPATWPVPFVATLVIDGKEDHVVNMWHPIEVDAGEDLVLRLKPMPVQKYTLNHYYKQPIYKSFPTDPNHNIVWQLVPDKLILEKDKDMFENFIHLQAHMPIQWEYVTQFNHRLRRKVYIPVTQFTWQELGYWHIGRTQIRMHKYNIDGGSYYHNDMVNSLRSQYMMMTFQPNWEILPVRVLEKHTIRCPHPSSIVRIDTKATNTSKPLKLSAMFETPKILKSQPKVSPWTFVKRKNISVPMENADNNTVQADTQEPPAVLAVVDESNVIKKANPKRRKIVTGSLIHSDGSTETQPIQSL